MRAGRGDGLAGVALVADPDVPVVVVRPVSARSGRRVVAAATMPPPRWSAPAGRRRRAGRRVRRSRQSKSGTAERQAVSVARPGGVGVGGALGKGLIAELQHQVVVARRSGTSGEPRSPSAAWSAGVAARRSSAGERHRSPVQAPSGRRCMPRHRLGPKPARGVEHDVYRAAPRRGLDAAQHDHAMRVGRQGQGVTALDDARCRSPSGCARSARLRSGHPRRSGRAG